MATPILLRDEDKQAVDRLVDSGRYDSPEDAVSEAIRLVVARDEWRAMADRAVEEGLADVDAGRTYSVEEVRAHFNARPRDAA